MSPPIKTCEHCKTVGVMPTSMAGETICYGCLKRLPTGAHDCRKRIVELESALTRITKDCTARKAVIIARNALKGVGNVS